MIDPLFGFDPVFLQKLERLALQGRHPAPGPLAGPRRSPRHGSSVEFADFRTYTPGDDFRRVDWNAYARLDRLFLHLYSAEQMTTVTLYLDCSTSMGFGSPSKAVTAARLAAILSFVALHTYDRVAIVGWSDRIHQDFPAQSGRGSIRAVWRHIAEVTASPAGDTDFSILQSYAGTHPGGARGRGLAIVLSDCLSDTNWRAGLRALRANGQEASLVQILAPDELQPDVLGDWQVHDSENGESVDVTVSSRLLQRYQVELERHTTDLRDFCRAQGIGFLQMPSDCDASDRFLGQLRIAGIVG